MMDGIDMRWRGSALAFPRGEGALEEGGRGMRAITLRVCSSHRPIPIFDFAVGLDGFFES